MEYERKRRVKNESKPFLIERNFFLLSCGKLWEDQIFRSGNEEFGFGYINFDIYVELLSERLDLKVCNSDTERLSNLPKVTQLLMLR